MSMPKSVAFLNDVVPCGQSAKTRRVGIHSAQRHGGVAVVKQPHAATSLVGFFHPFSMALKEMATFDCLYGRRLAFFMRGAHVGRVQ